MLIFGKIGREILGREEAAFRRANRGVLKLAEAGGPVAELLQRRLVETQRGHNCFGRADVLRESCKAIAAASAGQSPLRSPSGQ
jgi:hypothetical protein